MRTDGPAEGWVYRSVVGVVLLCVALGAIGPATAAKTAVDGSADAVTDNSTDAATDDLEIAYDGTVSTVFSFPAAEEFIVEATEGSFEFGANASTRIRIRNTDTGETVTVAPDADGGTYSLDKIHFFASTLIDYRDPFVRFDHQVGESQGPPFTMDVRVAGDLEMFLNETFAPYQVQVTDGDGTVLAETDSAVHGIGYQKPVVRYNGSAIAVERHPSVDEDWHVEIPRFDDQIRVGDIDMTNEDDDDFFIASLDDVELYCRTERLIDMRR